MKKFVSGVMALCLLAFNAIPVLAASIADVSQNYWASKEINIVVDNNIMTLSGNRFNPEGNMTRVEFVNALLKVLSDENLNVTISNKFKDVQSSNPNYENILRSQQLGLVYGYPDGTFKPNNSVLRSEAQSVISHITKDMDADTSVLNQFKDAAAIPAWAKKVYAKTINYGIYVNYPDSRELRPNDNLSRAEAAVLLARLKEKLDLVKQEYIGTTRIEHLDVKRNAPNNEVAINNIQSTIKEELSTKAESNVENINKKNKNSSIKNFSKMPEQYWPQIVNELKQNGKIVLYTNLMNTTAKEINDMTVGIEFPNGLTSFGKTVLEKQENIREISNLVSMAEGKPMQIKYIIGSSKVTKITNEQTIQNLANNSDIPFTIS